MNYFEIAHCCRAYIGLLGVKEQREEAEISVAIELLKKDKMEVDLAYVVTSTEGVVSWQSDKLNVQWILCDGDSMIDIDKIEGKVQIVLKDLIKDHLVIMDCTSFNKPATIAIYELAQQYMIPLIYVYRPKRKLKWLISRNDLINKFNI